MKKRNLSILLSLVMAAAIAGCGSSSTASSADSKAESSSAEEASSAAASASSVSGKSVGSSSVSSTSGNDTATATAGAITSDNYTPGTTQDAGEAAGKNITFIIKNTTAPFFISMKEGAEQAGKDYGVTVSVQAPTDTDEGAGNTQQTQLAEQAIASKTDCLCIAPVDNEAIMPAMKKVNDAGIPIVEVNSRLSDESFSSTFVGLENVQQGYDTMEQLIKGLNGEGKIFLIEGTTGAQTSADRITGAKKALEEDGPNIEVVAQQSANYNRAEALNVVQNLLQSNPDVDGIFCCNDEMALGAVEAVDSAGKTGDILITGQDANDDAVSALKEGKIYATSYGNPYMQGYMGVVAAVDTLNGGAKSDFYQVQTKVVTIDNADTFKD